MIFFCMWQKLAFIVFKLQKYSPSASVPSRSVTFTITRMLKLISRCFVTLFVSLVAYQLINMHNPL